MTARLLITLALLCVAAPLQAAPKAKKADTIWSHPDLASFGIESVALLPSATYENDLAKEKQVDAAVGLAVKESGHRWISPSLAKDLLRSAFKGDSVLKALDVMLLRSARVDSLAAPSLCAALRIDAVLGVRADRLERIEMEFNQAGKPSTTVQLTAALVDSAGRLLWTATGNLTAEGPYHDPSAGTLGVRSSGLNTAPMTGQGGAPALDEVLARLLERWKVQFPKKAAASG